MPGSSFCWGPELEGPRSPSSSRSSTPGQAGRDRRGCAARAPPPPPTRIPSTPHIPRTDPAPSRSFAPPTRRVARFACTSPPSALVCAGAQFCPPTSTRVGGGAPMRRDGGAAARVGREGAWEPGWGAGGDRWGCVEAPPRRGAWHIKKSMATVGGFFLCDLWTNPMM